MSPKETAPAFQWYPKDFLSSSRVMRMTPTERGIYITLLSVAWLEGGLPDDVEQLARMAGVPLKQFARIWPHNLRPCFAMVQNGRLVNERLEAEREKQRVYRERQTANGSKRGKTKPLDRESQNEPSLSQPSARALQTEDSRPVELVGTTKREGGPGETTPAPLDVPLDTWFRELQAAYPQNRVTSGHLTEHAWFEIFRTDLRPASVIWAEMLDNLENQKRGHDWRVKGMVPKLENWLAKGLWKQRHDEAAPVADRLSKSTTKTASAVAEIMRETA